MSRVKTILIAAILVVGILFPTTTLASPQATVSITDAALPPGASGSVVLSISATEPVSCIDVDITYNPAVVKVTRVTDASGSDFDRLVSNIQDNYTHLVAWVASPTGLPAGTIKVADITLTRLDGESELALDVITLKGPLNNPIPFTIDNGWVTSDGAPPVDDIPPTVISTSPANGATGVSITTTVRAIFSEVIKLGTLTFNVSGVSGTTTHTDTIATFTPSANLGYSRKYTASVSASDLAGNEMAVYSWSFTTAAASAAVGGGGGGPSPAPPTGTTDVRGQVSAAGVFIRDVAATSKDGLCALDIPADTVGLTEELEPLTEVSMLIMDEPPAPPEEGNVIGLAYDFQPSGATFDPPITLTFSYDPADIPEGIAEGDLVLAFYDEAAGEWVELEGCVVDPETNTITASLSHFTAFVVAFIPAPAAFSISGLEVSPAEVEIGGMISIRAVVENTGGMKGISKVTLKINGEVEQTKYIFLRLGTREGVSFAILRDVAGSYSVEINGLTGSFTVKAPPELAPSPAPPAPAPPAPVPPVPPAKPINWPVLGVIIAGVVLAGLSIFWLVRRRAA